MPKKYSGDSPEPVYEISIDESKPVNLTDASNPALFPPEQAVFLPFPGNNALIKELWEKMDAVGQKDGVLFGSSRAHKAARKIMLEEGELQGIISMPSGVFKPYAGVSTAILIFVKGGQTEKVWFYDMQADGYSLDDKRSKQEESDLPDIVLSWKKRHQKANEDRKAKHFFVPLEEIVENGYDLSINRYKEIVYEEVEYEPPLAIMEQIQSIDKERAALMQDLKGMIE